MQLLRRCLLKLAFRSHSRTSLTVLNYIKINDSYDSEFNMHKVFEKWKRLERQYNRIQYRKLKSETYEKRLLIEPRKNNTKAVTLQAAVNKTLSSRCGNNHGITV